jgi:monoamine oxidase
MLERFDDGGHEVPGGLAGPVRRVLVVGAGVAGLTVANALHHAGVECTVLEARRRVGGRLHTRDVLGTPVDLGGSWLHHPSGNVLRRFARLAGVECQPGDPLPTLSAFDVATGRWLSPEEVETSLTGDLGGFVSTLDALREREGAGASAAEGIEGFLAATGLTGEPLRRARQGLRASVEADAAGAAEDQSLAWLWTQDEYDDDYFGDLPNGGYVSVVEALAAGLDVRVDWPVVGVEVTEEGVSASSQSGRTERGSHVVVTVPLGVLRRGLPTFTPPLPDERVRVVHRLGFGRYEKVVLKFARPFWREAGWSHLVVFPPDPTQPAAWIFDLDAFGIGPVLVGHVFHSATVRVSTAWPAGAAQWLTDQLAVVLGEPCPQPVAVELTNWAGDPYAAGAYTHVTPGSSNEDLDLLGTPVAGRILFAGEHTQSARVGYADGAMSSGVREAKRLLGVPEVVLGRVTG